MSGIIRRNLKEARKCLDEEQLSAETTWDSCLTETSFELQHDQSIAERHIIMLETRIAQVEHYDTEWQTFVARLEDETAIEKEQREYEQYAYAEDKWHQVILRKRRD